MLKWGGIGPIGDIVGCGTTVSGGSKGNTREALRGMWLEEEVVVMAGEQTAAAARLELAGATAAITDEADDGSMCGLEEVRAFV